MESSKHPYHSLDYSNMRPSKSRVVTTAMPATTEWTHFKGEPVYRNLYYGTNIPKEQYDKTVVYNQYLQEELAKGTIKPHLPEFWSFHDSWRFADAASYKKEDMVRDAINHSPWIEEMKSFNLSPEAADILKKGALYIYGRDKYGYTNIWVDYKKSDTSEAGCKNTSDALIFLSAVVKKYCMLPYHCELFNIIIDIGNCSVFS